jgi:hypothetical protein
VERTLQPDGPSELERAYELAYKEAVRALSQQQSVLDSFRTRAGVLLSAAAVATSFFGGRALTDAGLTTWTWLGLILFLGVGGTLLALMAGGGVRDFLAVRGRAWEGFSGFASSPSVLIEGYIEADPPRALPETYRDVALYMEQHFNDTEGRIVRRLEATFRLASFLLVAEIAAWVAALAT